MAKSACRCKKAAECEECPEWIFTFADLVMLMMGFFVILWVLKPPAGKQGAGDSAAEAHWVEVEAAVRGAFGHVPDPQSKDPVDIEMIYHNLERLQLNGPGDGGKINHSDKLPEGHDDQVTSIRVGKYATEGGRLTFEQGSADLNADAKSALDEIAGVVRGHRNLIVVKGHASLDDFPVNGSADAKMQLSIHRAQATADYLVSQGVAAALLRVQGCSTFEPIVQHQYTAEALQANRRVEVETTATLVEELEDQHPPTTGPMIDATQPVGQ
jgi:outer membrane protein OmpA-like peptidoglycan-associated protein